eukprot:scaffold471_cov372-Pavlova_lutheri.AAC.3
MHVFLRVRGRVVNSLKVLSPCACVERCPVLSSNAPYVPKRTFSPRSPYEEPLVLLTNFEPVTGYLFLDLHDLRECQERSCLFLNYASAEELASEVKEALGRRLHLRGQDQLDCKVCGGGVKYSSPSRVNHPLKGFNG